MTMAALTGPKPKDSTLLNEHEYEGVATLLRLDRTSGNREANAIVSALRGCSEKNLELSNGSVLRCFLRGLLMDLGEYTDDLRGLFTDGWEGTVFLREEEEGDSRVQCVQALLKILEVDLGLPNS